MGFGALEEYGGGGGRVSSLLDEVTHGHMGPHLSKNIHDARPVPEGIRIIANVDISLYSFINSYIFLCEFAYFLCVFLYIFIFFRQN